MLKRRSGAYGLRHCRSERPVPGFAILLANAKQAMAATIAKSEESAPQ